MIRYKDINFKDNNPDTTISNIKNILDEIGINTSESNWYNSLQDYYSVTIRINNTNLSTNGKGITPSYALASAYGELMERLQNQAFFKLSVDVSPRALKYKGFYYCPDEKKMSLDKILKFDNEWFEIQGKLIKKEIDIKGLIKKWMQIAYEDFDEDFVCIPYNNLYSKKKSYIPIKMVSKMYMSNGMCAGNTREEALVQGLSEIFERYVNQKILMENITPPDIPKNYIAKYPLLNKMINELEESGIYKVIVKDCSLGKGYPVIGVIVINRFNQTYFVKFGAHPKFEIALQRTLTELLQGQNAKMLKGVTEFSSIPKVENPHNNMIGILVNGSGVYHKELFSSNHSYEFNGFLDVDSNENSDMLKYLLDILEKEGYCVFVRNVSFLGFPSYHVIVPGFSEIELIDDIEALDSYINFVSIKKYLRNINSLNSNECRYLVDTLNSLNITNKLSIPRILNLNMIDNFNWYYSDIELLKCVLCYKNGEFENSFNYIDKFIKGLKKPTLDVYNYTYYRCARDFIGNRASKFNLNESIELLENFYSIEIIKDVVDNFYDNNKVIDGFEPISCWNCNKCPYYNKCFSKEHDRIFMNLKDRYALN